MCGEKLRHWDWLLDMDHVSVVQPDLLGVSAVAFSNSALWMNRMAGYNTGSIV